MSNEEEILQLLREGKEERKQLREDFNKLEKAVHNNNVRNQRIETKLIGDKEYETPGLIHEVESLKKFKHKEELNKAKQRGIIAGISLAFGALGTWLKQIIG